MAYKKKKRIKGWIFTGQGTKKIRVIFLLLTSTSLKSGTAHGCGLQVTENLSGLNLTEWTSVGTKTPSRRMPAGSNSPFLLSQLALGRRARTHAHTHLFHTPFWA